MMPSSVRPTTASGITRTSSAALAASLICLTPCRPVEGDRTEAIAADDGKALFWRRGGAGTPSGPRGPQRVRRIAIEVVAVPVVAAGRPGVSVPHRVLDVLQRD